MPGIPAFVESDVGRRKRRRRLAPTGPIELWVSPVLPGERGEELLRRVLARRLGGSLPELAFRRGERGKPELVGGELAFNLSHSGGLAVIAVAERGEVGVDLEQVRPLRRLDLLEQGALTRDERRTLGRAGGEPARTHCFLRHWTAKEAVAKAFGAGLALAPQRLEVAEMDAERALVKVSPADAGALPDGAEAVEVRRFQPADGFLAAIAGGGAWDECRPPRRLA
jgi:4'-phosphopantetheinyl transferase